MNENVFYTAIFGNNIPIDKPEYFDKIEGWDYILFTNFDPSLFNTSWDIIKVDKPFDCNVMCARNIKWNGHESLDRYKKMVWMDAYVKFKKNDKELCQIYMMLEKNNKDIMFKKHPKRNCIYRECEEVIRAKKDNVINVSLNKNVFIRDKMPVNFGLFETNIIFYNNKKNIRDFMKIVFEFMIGKSYRDQLSLTYNIWRHRFKDYMSLNYVDIQSLITGKPPHNHTPESYIS